MEVNVSFKLYTIKYRDKTRKRLHIPRIVFELVIQEALDSKCESMLAFV